MSPHTVSEFVRARAKRLGLRIEYRKEEDAPGPFCLVDIESGKDVVPGMQLSLIPDALRCWERELQTGTAAAAWSDLFRRAAP